MTGPGGLGLIPRTGPKVPTSVASRPGPQMQPRRSWTADPGGPLEVPGEWGPPAFTLSASANITAAGADATTARLTAPGGTFSAGRRVDDSGTTPSTTITASGYTEHEWAIEALPAAANGDVYEFRVIRADGAELAAYTVTPQWTIGSGVPTTNAPATVAPVTVSATSATALVQPAAGSSAVATTGQPATGQARPNAGSAPVTTTGQPATAAVRPAAGSAPVTATAPAPTVTVLAQAGVAAVAAAALDATALIGTRPTVAPVTVTGQAASTTTPPAGPTVLGTFNPSTNDPQSITITGATAGRDIWLIVNSAATITTPTNWELTTSRVADVATYIYRLPGSLNTGGSIGVTLDLAAARSAAAVAIESPTADTGSVYASLVAPPNGTGSTVWGTNVHTFSAKAEVFALYAYHDTTGTPPTFTASSYDQGFTAFADTGWAPGTAGDEAARVLVGANTGIGFTADGVALTLSAAGPAGSAVGFLAFDLAPAGTVNAIYAPVGVAAGAAAVTVRGPATSGPVALAAPAPTVLAALQAGAGAATLTGQPATTTVRAQAGVAAVTAQGQAATVNTSSSTNANAGVAAVGVAASAAAASVRPAATSAPVGAAGLFDTGSEVLLQLVMDNPVGITVTAYNATVSTSAGPTNANATSAPVTVSAQAATAQARPGPGSAPVALTAPTPAVTVRANAGVAAVGVAGQAAAVQTTSQTLAQAGTATVATTAAGPAATVRANPTGAPITATANAPLVSTGGQVFAPATVAAIATSSAPPVATLRPAAGGAVAALSAAGPLTTLRLRPTTATVITLALAASGPPPQFAGGLNVLLQIQTLTKVRPAETTDGYGNTVLDYGVAATRTTFAGWIWQANRGETRPDGRNPAEQVWELMCNESDLLTDDRVEWPSGHPSGALTFAIEGPPQPSYRAGSGFGAGGFHHTEASMRLVEG